MMQNQNEKYLLKFISSQVSNSAQNDLLNVVFDLGIKIDFKNSNPVYQIIDELNYANYHLV